jgi:hypothetical protein
MVTEGIEPSTVALLAQRSNQLSYATYLKVSLLPRFLKLNFFIGVSSLEVNVSFIHFLELTWSYFKKKVLIE